MTSTGELPPPGEERVEAGNVYGNTSIAGHAVTHLGNVANNINVQGGVHVHFNSPLETLSVCDLLVRRLQTAIGALKQAEDIVERRTGTRTVSLIAAKLVDLRRINGADQRIADQRRLQRANILPARNKFEAAFAEVRNFATGVWQYLKILKILPSSLNDRSLPHVPIGRYNLSSIDPQTLYGLFQTGDDTLINVNWTLLELKSRAAEALPIRTSINELARILFSPQQFDSASDPLANAFTGLKLEDHVVEVLTLSRDFQAKELDYSLSQSFLAMTTQQNGDMKTFADSTKPPDMSDVQHSDRLIQYNFRPSSQPADLARMAEVFPDYSKAIQKYLYFREESDRRVSLKDAHEKTFHWVLQSIAEPSMCRLKNWLETNQKIYWIKGKAGSGKSTLMKHIHQHPHLPELLAPWADSRQLLIVSFFFWHLGTPLQKSYEGLLRSLLYQILSQSPDLTSEAFPRLTRYLLLKGDSDSFDISIDELQEALTLLTKTISPKTAILLMIDGVDEFSGDLFDFCRFLSRLPDGFRVKVLVSSREVPECTQMFSRFPCLRLQDLTRQDIKAYINHELLQDSNMQLMCDLEEDLSGLIANELSDKAQGVFLWIVIVVRRLLIALGNFESRQTILQRINELPRDLADLYDHMFAKMPLDHQREGSFVLQLTKMTYDRQKIPFTVLHLFMALRGTSQGSMISGSVETRQSKEPRFAQFVSGILQSRCCGLVEVEHPAGDYLLYESQIVFLHRTVYEYLADSAIWSKVTTACEMTFEKTALSLLSSCVAALEFRAITPCVDNLAQPASVANYFASCLDYTNFLLPTKNTSYIGRLLTAHRLLIDYYSNSLSSHEPIHMMFDPFERTMSSRGLSEIIAVLRTGFGNLGTRMAFVSFLILAHLKLFDYLAAFVKTDNFQQCSRPVMLLRLLHFIARAKTDRELRPTCGQAAKILIEHAVDVNEAVEDTSELVECDYGLSNWQYWKNCHRTSDMDETALLATLWLVEAGGRFGDEDSKPAAIVRRLELYRRSTKDEDIKCRIDRIMELGQTDL